MSKDTFAGVGIGLGIGMLIGVAFGMLYAPRAGHETRKAIRDKAGKFAGDVRAKVNRATIKDIKGQ